MPLLLLLLLLHAPQLQAAPAPRLVLSGGLVDRSGEDGRIDGVRGSAGLAIGDLELGVEGDVGLDPFGWSEMDAVIAELGSTNGYLWPVDNDRWGASMLGRWAIGAGTRSGLSGGPSFIVAPGVHRVQRTFLSVLASGTEQALVYTPTERNWVPGLLTGGELEVWAGGRVGARLRLAHDLRWSPEPTYSLGTPKERELTSSFSTTLDLCWMGVSR
jgi:hypothetical protein